MIPRTVIYKLEFEEGPLRLLIIEAASPVETVKRYRNELGQLGEHAPYCERDMRPPHELITDTSKGEFLMKIKSKGTCISTCMTTHRWIWLVGMGSCGLMHFPFTTLNPLPVAFINLHRCIKHFRRIIL